LFTFSLEPTEQTPENKKPGINELDPGIPCFPRIDTTLLFHGRTAITISDRFSDFRINRRSHLPRIYSQWLNVNFVPGYSGGPVLDLHEIPSIPLCGVLAQMKSI